MGALAILLMLIGLVAAVIGFGPACISFPATPTLPALEDICLAPAGQFAFIVVAVLCAIGVAFIFFRPRRRR